jgi:hypothetical protein
MIKRIDFMYKLFACLILLMISILGVGCMQNDSLKGITPKIDSRYLFDANFSDYNGPDVFETNVSSLTFLNITNLGTDEWNMMDPNAVHLSYHWVIDNQTIVFEGIRSNLPNNIPAGGSAHVQLKVRGPERPGNYTLVIDLVKENVTWFASKNTTPLIKLVHVIPNQLAINSTFNYTTEDSSILGLNPLLTSALNSNLISFKGKSGQIYGFSSGAGYPQIWVRDSATIVPFARYFCGDEYMETWIDEFLYCQADNGSICDFISPTGVDKESVETDQEASLVHSAYLYYTITGNVSWLQKDINGTRIIDRLDKSLMWVEKNRYNQRYGLITGAYTADWGDVQFEDVPGTYITDKTHYTSDIYDNGMFYRACIELSKLYGDLGDNEREKFWDLRAESIRNGINEYLWDKEKGIYNMHLILADNEVGFNDSHIVAMGGNAVAILAGCTNQSQSGQIIETINQEYNKINASSIGCVLYPPYPDGFFANPIMNEKYEYQNGGIWDWFAGRFILAEFEQGFSRQAITHLDEVANQDIRAGGLYEWYTLDGKGMGSENYTGSAAVLGNCLIEGYFGINLTNTTLRISPRLGDRNGSISISEPVTGIYISYIYTSIPDNTLIFNYKTNFLHPFTVNILIPEGKHVEGVMFDGESHEYSMFYLRNDAYATINVSSGTHECRVLI